MFSNIYQKKMIKHISFSSHQKFPCTKTFNLKIEKKQQLH